MTAIDPQLHITLYMPTLAAPGTLTEADLDKLNYPVIAMPKYDGVRFRGKHTSIVSRTMTPFPNKVLKQVDFALHDVDGELCILDTMTGQHLPCRDVVSFVSSDYKELPAHQEILLYAFDICSWKVASWSFGDRLEYLNAILPHPYRIRVGQCRIDVQAVHGVRTTCPSELLAFYKQCISQNFEGIVVRSPNAPYKSGRATINDEVMFRMVPRPRAEARILEVLQKRALVSVNVEKNAFGLAKRVTRKSAKQLVESMGAILVEDINTGVRFKLGTGFDEELRNWIWQNRDDVIGRLVTYESLDAGVKVKPRNASFVSFRDNII